MFSLLTSSTLLLAAVSSVSGLAISRQSAPAGYFEDYLEPYATYHARYLAIGCKTQHNTPFFDQCCHPMLKTENLATARPAQCSPSSSAGSSASPAAASSAPPAASPSASAAPATPTQDAGAPADDDDDLPFCDEDDGDDDDDASSSAAATSTQAAPAADANPTPAPAAPSPAASSSPAAAPAASSSPEASNPAPSQAPDNSQSAPASTGGDFFEGGSATFFTQNGVAGACGTVHQDSDFVIAMDSRMYGDTGKQSQFCGRQIEIHNTNNGKSVVATVADACPTCNNQNSLDLSVGAFEQIATQAEGLVPIKWKFV